MEDRNSSSDFVSEKRGEEREFFTHWRWGRCSWFKRKEKKVDLERPLSRLLPAFLHTVAPNEASGYPESEHLIYDRNLLCKGDCYINVAWVLQNLVT